MRNRNYSVFSVALIFVSLCLGCSANRALQLTHDEMLNLGETLLEERSFPQSRQVLQQVRERYPTSSDAPIAQLLIGDSYFEQDRYSEAASEYSIFLRFYPAHDRADYAQYRLALSRFHNTYKPFRDQKPTQEAITAFEQLLQRYPDSEYVEEADEKLAELRNRLATHELQVARFYFKQDECNASKMRTEHLLDQYPASELKDEAMYVLGLSHECLGEPTKAQEVFERLLEEYPGSSKADLAQQRLSQLKAMSAGETIDPEKET